MNTVEQILAYLFGFGLLVLAFRLAVKERLKSCLICVVIGFVAFFSAQSWFQGLFKTEIISRTFSTLEAYGKRLDDFQATTAKMRAELAEHQRLIATHQKELADQQTTLRIAQTNVALQEGDLSIAQTSIAAQQQSITNQYDQLAQLQTTLESAQTNITKQQEKLSDITYWVNNLFDNLIVETVRLTDTNKVMLLNTNGMLCVCVTLDNVPIPRSVQLTVLSGDVFDVPKTETIQSSTYLNFLFKGLVNYNVKTTTLTIQYVKDTRKTCLTEHLQLRGNSYFLKDTCIATFEPGGVGVYQGH